MARILVADRRTGWRRTHCRAQVGVLSGHGRAIRRTGHAFARRQHRLRTFNRTQVTVGDRHSGQRLIRSVGHHVGPGDRITHRDFRTRRGIGILAVGGLLDDD